VNIKAVISDIYTTLIEIRTDEKELYPYAHLASYLKYFGVYLSAEELKWFFFEKKALQKKKSNEEYPEVDYKKIWYDILHENRYSYSGPDINGSSFVRDVVMLHRSLITKRIGLYMDVYGTLDMLKKKGYLLGIVSDSQPEHAYPELRMLGIDGFFDTKIISGEFGYKKPDRRLFEECMRRLGVSPSESIYIGNDLDRDIRGANNAGMNSVLVMTKHGQDDIGQDIPHYTIDRISEISRVLDDLLKK
jgi:putative hydrolase of the HAD superfamily